MANIICNNKPISIGWDKVINVKEEGALALSQGYSSRKPYQRAISKIITHWDVCRSSKHCFKYMQKEGDLSTHFSIDNDGTIYQFLDTRHKAWHASGANAESIGIDLSTAYYLEHQEWYLKNLGKEKPIVRDATVNDETLDPHLGFFPEQIEAYKQLLISLVRYYKIPLRFPCTKTGELLQEYFEGSKKFTGIMCHYHSQSGKIDVAGLPLDSIVRELRTSFQETKQ